MIVLVVFKVLLLLELLVVPSDLGDDKRLLLLRFPILVRVIPADMGRRLFCGIPLVFLVLRRCGLLPPGAALAGRLIVFNEFLFWLSNLSNFCFAFFSTNFLFFSFAFFKFILFCATRLTNR